MRTLRRAWTRLAVILSLALFLLPVVAFAQNRPAPSVPYFDIPAQATLFGETVPLERRDLREILDESLVITAYNYERVILLMKRAARYFPYLEKKLHERGLPDDLKYVAVAESSLRTYAYSSARAVGPWQFIEATAKRNGLRVNAWFDDRLSFERSTEAALSYFEVLYKKFGSWTLAAAAYNSGEQRITNAIATQGQKDYFNLNLPIETEQYIFRILAAKIILSNPQFFGYRIPASLLYPPLVFDRVEFDAPREIPVTLLAKACDTTYKDIREMNPEIRGDALPAGRHSLYVPRGKAERFKAALPELLASEPSKSGKARHPRKKRRR
ncbi:MAG: lytic transglycosylase domain-containing protein [Syntrophaceae bacterium]|nr:lytic transglycosylase domain-containing protein [Syntrophaceae bacterium]